MAKQDDYQFTDLDKLVGRLAAELSSLSLGDRLSAIRCSCTLDELDYIAVDLADYVRADRAGTLRAKTPESDRSNADNRKP